MTPEEINTLVQWISIGLNIVFIICVIPLIIHEIKDIREMKKMDKQLDEQLKKLLDKR